MPAAPPRITGENFEDAELGPRQVGGGVARLVAEANPVAAAKGRQQTPGTGGGNSGVPGQRFTPPPGYAKPPSCPADKTPPEKDKPTDSEKKDKPTDTQKKRNSTDTEKPSNP